MLLQGTLSLSDQTLTCLLFVSCLCSFFINVLIVIIVYTAHKSISVIKENGKKKLFSDAILKQTIKI